MDQASVKKVSREVAKQFPELSGVKPSVREEKRSRSGPRFLLTYKGKADLPGGKSLPRIVRVVADEAGHILRLTTSR